jgi:exodeoxyribonuclease-5
MACNNIFINKENGGYITTVDGSIEIELPNGTISETFRQVKDLDISKDTLDTFDVSFLESLEKHGFIRDWKNDKDQAALGMYAKLYTAGFFKVFGDWTQSIDDVKGEVNANGEPVVHSNGDIFIGADIFNIFGKGGVLHTAIPMEAFDIIDNTADVIWVTPGNNTNPVISLTNDRFSKYKGFEILDEFELFPGVFATDEQQEAITAIDEFINSDETNDPIFTLIGRGGTGKSTIIKKAIHNSGISPEDILFMAPTQKASDVLRDMVGPENTVLTMHKGYGFRPVPGMFTPTGDPVFKLIAKKTPALDYKYLVIDEGSMIDDNFYNHILNMAREFGQKVIIMGDNVQLAMDEEDSKVFKHVKSKLTKRIRQADESPILPITDTVADAVENPDQTNRVAIKERITSFDVNDNAGVIFESDEDTVFKIWKKDFEVNPYSTKIVSFNNAAYTGTTKLSVGEVNRIARQMLFGDKVVDEYLEGEILIANSDVYATKPTPIVNSAEYRIDSISKKKRYADYTISSFSGHELTLPALEYYTATLSNIKDIREGKTKIRQSKKVVLLTRESQAIISAIFLKLKGRTPDLKNISIEKHGEINEYLNNLGVAYPATGKAAYQLAGTIKGHFPAMSYGYAVTAHKVQGSTYRNVYVMEDNITDQKTGNVKKLNQALYVAVSRASDKLVMLSRYNEQNNAENLEVISAKIANKKIYAYKDLKEMDVLPKDVTLTPNTPPLYSNIKMFREGIKQVVQDFGGLTVKIDKDGNILGRSHIDEDSVKTGTVVDYDPETQTATIELEDGSKLTDKKFKYKIINDSSLLASVKGLKMRLDSIDIDVNNHFDVFDGIASEYVYDNAEIHDELNTPVTFLVIYIAASMYTDGNKLKIDRKILKDAVPEITDERIDAIEAYARKEVEETPLNGYGSYSTDDELQGLGNPYTGTYDKKKKNNFGILVTENDKGEKVQPNTIAALEAASKKYRDLILGYTGVISSDLYEKMTDLQYIISEDTLEGTVIGDMRIPYALAQQGITAYKTHIDHLLELNNTPKYRAHIRDIRLRFPGGSIALRTKLFNSKSIINMNSRIMDAMDGILSIYVPAEHLIDDSALSIIPTELEKIGIKDSTFNKQEYDEGDIAMLFTTLLTADIKPVADDVKKSKKSIEVHSKKGDYTDLSNFAQRKFTVKGGLLDGLTFNSVEGAFHASKVAEGASATNITSYDGISKDMKNAIKHLQKASGIAALQYGRRLIIPGFDPNAWDTKKEDIAKSLMKQSFDQNENAKNRLLETGDAIITHSVNGQWASSFPRILMEIRNDYAKTNPLNTNALAEEKLVDRVFEEAMKIFRNKGVVVTKSLKKGIRTDKDLIARLEAIGAVGVTDYYSKGTIAWKLPYSIDSSVIPKYTLDTNIDDGALARVIKNRGIVISRLSSLEDFYAHFEGNKNSVVSKQKKKVLAKLEKEGYPLDKIKKSIATLEDAYLFLIFHEESHVIHNDARVYEDNDFNYDAEAVLDIEVRATVQAIEKLKRFRKAEKKYSYLLPEVVKNANAAKRILPENISETQESHLKKLNKNGDASTIEIIPGGFVNLEEAVMQELGLKTRLELKQHIVDVGDVKMQEIYDSVLEKYTSKSMRALTSSYYMLDKANVIYYNEDATSIKKGAADENIVDDSDWDLHKATKTLNKIKRLISNKEGVKINLDEMTGSFYERVIQENGTQSAKNTLDVLNTMLKHHPELIVKGYDKILGSTLSADVKSQLLSAATDNAKELILGDIGANSDTNGIITAMLLQGYYLQDIVDFLHSPNIQKVLALWEDKKDKKDTAPLSWYNIQKEEALSSILDTKELQSLQRILIVGSDILKFSGIRSLSENFRIQSFKIDSIFDGVFADALYNAIKLDTTTPIDNAIIDYKKKNKDSLEKFTAGNVFNANYMIFYHPQSRSIFKKMYENERFLLPALFKSKIHLDDFLTQYDRDEEVYKKVNRYLSKMYVQDFYNKKDKDNNFRVGLIVDKDTNTLKKYSLNTYEGRELFINEFANFINYAKKKLDSLGYSNIALNSISFDKPYGSTTPVANIRAYSMKSTDPATKSAIVQSIKDMKLLLENNDEVNDLHAKIYSNLSNYALITSGGHPGNGFMLELFPEINIDLSEHIDSLKDDFYMDVLPEGTMGDPIDVVFRPIVTGRIPTYNALVAKEEGKISNNYAAEAADYMEEAYDGEYSVDIKENLFSTIHSGVAVGKVFTKPNIYGIKDEIFYGSDTGNAYRVFDAANPLAIPNTLSTDGMQIFGVDNDVIDALSLAGKQIGYDITIGGKKGRILGYIKSDYITTELGGYYESIYSVAFDGDSVFREIPGSVLMVQNPELVLSGNIITKLDSYSFKYIKQDIKDIKEIAARYASRGTEWSITKESAINSLKIPSDLKKDLVAWDLVDSHGLFDEIKFSTKAETSLTSDKITSNTYKVFLNSKLNRNTTNPKKIFIPSIRGAVDINMVTAAKAEVFDKLHGFINSLPIGESISFIVNDSEISDIITGKNILTDTLRNRKGIEISAMRPGDGSVVVTVKKLNDVNAIHLNDTRFLYRVVNTDNATRIVIDGKYTPGAKKKIELGILYKNQLENNTLHNYIIYKEHINKPGKLSVLLLDTGDDFEKHTVFEDNAGTLIIDRHLDQINDIPTDIIDKLNDQRNNNCKL